MHPIIGKVKTMEKVARSKLVLSAKTKLIEALNAKDLVSRLELMAESDRMLLAAGYQFVNGKLTFVEKD